MNLLAYKALVLEPERKVLVSPQKHFEWPPGKVVIATCHKGHKPPSSSCKCGLYGATSMKIIRGYARNAYGVILLMNTYGDVEVWDQGVRAYGMRPVAIVDTAIDGRGVADVDILDVRRMAILAVSDLYQLDILPLDLCRNLIKETWKIHVPEVSTDHV